MGLLSVLLLYRGFSNSQIGTVSALALLMPLAVQPVLASLADRNRRFTSRRLAMALTGLLPLCAVGLWCSAGSMAVTAALYVLVGISLTATAPFHSAMAMELQQHGVALNYGLSRGLGSACYAASVLVLGVVVERYAPHGGAAGICRGNAAAPAADMALPGLPPRWRPPQEAARCCPWDRCCGVTPPTHGFWWAVRC